MKKIIVILMMTAFLWSCNNAGEGTGTEDSLEPDVNTNVMSDSASRDTSSYERMPGHIHDSVPR